MSRVAYAVPQQGFRPATNPLGALRGFGLRGLGDDSSDNAPSVITIDDTGDPAVTSGGSYSLPISSSAPYGAIQQGSYSLFGAAWPWLAAFGILMVARNVGRGGSSGGGGRKRR